MNKCSGISTTRRNLETSKLVLVMACVRKVWVFRRVKQVTYLKDTKVKSCPVYIWEDYWLFYYLLRYTITNFDIPILRRIPVTFTKRVVQENLGWVVPRFKSKEHDLICSIIMVYNHRRKGCWSLSDMYSPWIPSSSLNDSIVSHGLNEETAEFP